MRSGAGAPSEPAAIPMAASHLALAACEDTLAPVAHPHLPAAMKRLEAEFSVDLEGLVDISFFSVRPELGETLYPPCTYFELRSETNAAAMVDVENDGKKVEVKYSIIESAPWLAGQR